MVLELLEVILELLEVVLDLQEVVLELLEVLPELLEVDLELLVALLELLRRFALNHPSRAVYVPACCQCRPHKILKRPGLMFASWQAVWLDAHVLADFVLVSRVKHAVPPMCRIGEARRDVGLMHSNLQDALYRTYAVPCLNLSLKMP